MPPFCLSRDLNYNRTVSVTFLPLFTRAVFNNNSYLFLITVLQAMESISGSTSEPANRNTVAFNLFTTLTATARLFGSYQQMEKENTNFLQRWRF